MATVRKTNSQKRTAPLKAGLVHRPRWSWVVFSAVALVALGLGLLATYMAGWHIGRSDTYAALATPTAIAQAKQDILAQYEAVSVAHNCVDPATNAPYDGKAYFAKYLQVNAYANRAVIRACNTNGTLLAKIDGSWRATEVNLNLSARANPVWARACWASDILTPDTTVRPENGSIDSSNLKMCRALQAGKILTVQDL